MVNNESNQDRSDLFDLMQKLKSKKENLIKQIEQVDTDLEAVIKTMNLLKAISSEQPHSRPQLTIANLNLSGMTQVGALIEIAKNNGNRLKITQGRDLLIQAGLMKKTKNSFNIAYNSVKRSQRFKHIAPGEYELLPETKSGTLLNLLDGIQNK